MQRTDIEHRREHVLEVAESLLQRDGYKRTTIAGIAKEAGISVGSVYLEFDSKDAIVAELSRRCHLGILERMRLAADEASNPANAIRDALEARVLGQHAHANRHPHSLELFHCHACAGVGRALDEVAPMERKFVTELLEDGAERGFFDLVDRADVVAGTILRLLDRLGPAHEQHLQGRSLEREVARACEILVCGLRAT